MKKFVYSFNEGSKDMKDILGSKGANLAEMTRMGLPVPFGFTITTEACNKYYEDGNAISGGIFAEIDEKLADLETVTGKKFGEAHNPLLLSVRSGSAFSMPGTLDTILNLGINDVTVKGLAEATQNERFAYDSYRRLLQMFGTIIYNIPKEKFEALLLEVKAERDCDHHNELCVEALKDLIDQYKVVIKLETGDDFPQDPRAQLEAAIIAVFNSWNSERMAYHKERCNVPPEAGIAVNVQHMVFGNTGEESGTGVATTRNKTTGENRITGDFLFNAQGEDVLSEDRAGDLEILKERLPNIYKQFVRIAAILEQHYKDVQKIEFTVENGRLYILQTRTARRTPAANIKTSVDMAQEGIIDRRTAIMRVKPEDIESIVNERLEGEGEIIFDDDFKTFMKWTDEARTLKVRANADTIEEVERAIELGVEGIGIFRTEKMTFDSMNAPDMFEYQKDYFKRLFETLDGIPVGIRLFCPVFGRLVSIDTKELVEKQAAAIVTAASELKEEKNIDVFPGIIISLVGLNGEYSKIKGFVTDAISNVAGLNCEYYIGSIVDVPRTALIAAEIAKDADFLSFEMDDLTRMTLGFSRGDSTGFLGKYRESFGMAGRDLLRGIDSLGAGGLVKTAVDVAKSVKPAIKFGMCKEYGSDADAIEFCISLGFNYISCQPASIPVAKLAAVQAVIKSR